MTALVLAPFSTSALAELERMMPVVYESWHQTRRLHSPDELVARLNSERVSTLVIEADFVFEEVFQGASCLKFLGVCRSGLNHVDLEAATYHGVAVVYTPGRNVAAVAELTLGLMLSLARNIPWAHQYVHQGCWQNPVEPYLTLRGSELGGKTLGIIGVGMVGRRVAQLARSIGMKVVGYDPLASPAEHSRWRISLVPLEQLLGSADFISLHTAASPGTESLLDADMLRHTRPGVYIINTAQPWVVDEVALAQMISRGHVAGAAIDVHATHPIPPNSPLLGLNRVILTPHIGGATEETVERHSCMIVQELRRYLQGKRPLHLANPEVWRRLD